jgi:hypothetical protein
MESPGGRGSLGDPRYELINWRVTPKVIVDFFYVDTAYLGGDSEPANTRQLVDRNYPDILSMASFHS